MINKSISSSSLVNEIMRRYNSFD